MKTNYAGIPDKYAKKETSKIVILPISYNNIASIPAFLEASNHMEWYDIETGSEVYKKGIYLADTIAKNTAPQEMIDTVYNNIKTYLNTNKFVTIIGGERSTSIGSIKAFNNHFENLTVVQIDAHAHLHKEFNGDKVNNACSMYHASQTTNLIQVGIRSMAVIEKTVLDEEKMFFAHDMAADDYWMETVVESTSENVFISFDLDSLDPSIMSSVSNPEQGGLFWYETLDFLYKLFKERNVVGLELIGLSPNENNKAPDALAARLFYKMLSYKFGHENEDETEINESNFSSKENKVGKFNDRTS